MLNERPSETGRATLAAVIRLGRIVRIGTLTCNDKSNPFLEIRYMGGNKPPIFGSRTWMHA